jgi:NAD+ diphosphatase
VSHAPSPDAGTAGLPFAFVADPLDRADALRDDPVALARLWREGRVIVLDADGQSLANAELHLHTLAGAALGDMPGSSVFLGLRGGQAWFAVSADDSVAEAPQRIDLRRAAGLWPAADATVFAQARALLNWHARHRHCGACGGVVDFVRAGWLGRCRACAMDHYPRTDQAMIAAVTDGRRLLLGRQAGWPARRYSVLAGFVEPGESLEQTVAREVFEEAGVRVRSCRYLASQPWPFPGSLMLGFMARAEPDPPVVGDELEDARWFDADAVRAGLARDGSEPFAEHDPAIVLSPSISIARWLVEQWLAELETSP